MNSLMLRTPTFGGLFKDLEREIESVMGSPWGEPPAGYRAPVDVTEDDSGYTLAFDVPGVDRKDIGIEVKDGTLTVTGQRKSENEARDGSYAYCERAHGSFSRSFRLPENAKDEVTAKLEGGVLEVRVAKAPEAKARRIEVK